MRPTVYKILLWGLLALIFAIFAVVLSTNSSQRRMETCDGLNVEFSDPFNFVTEEDIKSCIEKHYGAFVGQRVDSVDLKKIEDLVDNQSAVLKSEVYLTRDGRLNVLVSQREPVVRFQKEDTGFYADERGYIFPLQSKYTSDVPVVDGNIPVAYTEGYKGALEDEKEKEWLCGLLDMLDFIGSSRTWSDGIVQMHVSEDGDLMLVPRIGRERFIIGYPDEIPEKFSRIEKYYQYIRPEKGEDFYSTVNVKFDGQIICRK